MKIMQMPYDGNVPVYTWQEGVKLIVESCHENGYVTIGRKQNARRYYNTFVTLDIETTKLLNENWTRKMSNKFKYFNYTYLWGACVDGKFICGREIADFFSMIHAIQTMIDGYIVAEVHNLAFEFFNNVDYFTKTEYEEGFFRNSSTPLYIRLKGFEFRCTAQLTHKSLAQIGKEVKIDKLDDFAYDRLLSPLSELTVNDYNYQYRDVYILYVFIKREIENYSKRAHVAPNPAALPLTQTGYVRNDVKKNFSRTNAGYLMLKNTELTEDEYKFIRPAFYGGYVHANFRIIGREFLRAEGYALLHVDLKSAYPWAIVTKRFMLKLTEADNDVDEYDLMEWLQRDNFGFVADVVLWGVELKPKHIPYIPYDAFNIKSIQLDATSENGKLVTCEAMQITICDDDLRLFLDTYDIERMDVKRAYFGTKKRLPYNIVATVVSYFNSKSTLKDVTTGDPDADSYIAYLYSLEKQKLNGIYGLFSTSLENFTYDVNTQTLMVDKSDEPEYKPAKVLPYQIALQITAYVRAAIVNMCNYLCETEGNQFWYCDTDSIFCKDTDEAREYVRKWNADRIAEAEELSLLYFDVIPVSPKGKRQILGCFDIEPECNVSDDPINKPYAVSFATIGAKRYYIGYSDGTYEITFSGLRGTKRVFDKATKTWHNGYNTQRLIDRYGSMINAFLQIKEGSVSLPFVDGVDKLGHYNVRANFVSNAFGYKVQRPCSYTLFGQSINLSLNGSLKWFLESQDYNNLMAAEDDM